MSSAVLLRHGEELVGLPGSRWSRRGGREQPPALKQEFKSIAFLWGEGLREDPIVPVLKEWKDDILYGASCSCVCRP